MCNVIMLDGKLVIRLYLCRSAQATRSFENGRGLSVLLRKAPLPKQSLLKFSVWRDEKIGKLVGLTHVLSEKGGPRAVRGKYLLKNHSVSS